MKEVIPDSMAPVIVLSKELVVVAEVLVEELEMLALTGEHKCIEQEKKNYLLLANSPQSWALIR